MQSSRSSEGRTFHQMTLSSSPFFFVNKKEKKEKISLFFFLSIFRMKFSIIASALLVASAVNARPFTTNEEGTIAPLFVPPKVETVQDSYIVILKNHLAGQDIEEHAQWINSIVKENQKDEMMLDWLNPHMTSHGIEHVYDTPFIKGYAGRFDENILNAIRQSEDVNCE